MLHWENFLGAKARGDHSREQGVGWHGRRKKVCRQTPSPPSVGRWRLFSSGFFWGNTVVLPVSSHKPSLNLMGVLYVTAGGDVSLHSYLSGQPTEESQLSMLACFLIYHSVPTPGQLAAGGLEGKTGVQDSTLNLHGHTLLGLALHTKRSIFCKLCDSVPFLWKLFHQFLFFINCLEFGHKRLRLYAGLKKSELACIKKSLDFFLTCR